MWFTHPIRGLAEGFGFSIGIGARREVLATPRFWAQLDLLAERLGKSRESIRKPAAP